MLRSNHLLLSALSHQVRTDSATPRTAARQTFLFFTVSPSSLKSMSTESMTPSNHLIPSLTSIWFQSVFIPLEGNPRPTSNHCPVPDSQPQATTNLLSVSLDSLTLDIYYRWNHTICSLECLAFFTEPCQDSSTCQCKFLLTPEHCCMGWPDHILLSIRLVDIWTFPLSGCWNSTAGNIRVRVFTWICFHLLGVEVLAQMVTLCPLDFLKSTWWLEPSGLPLSQAL